MNGPQQLELTQIDPRLSSLRLTNPQDLKRLQESIHSEGRIRDPVLVSTDVEPERWVLVDGFKRLRVAQDMGLTHMWVQTAKLDIAHAKAAILHCNQPREGLCKLEEVWIVRSLCEQGLMQTQVAELLKRDKSWVCRRMKIAEDLEESLQDQVKRGLLSATLACQLSQLQRCNQQPVAQAVRDHQLSSRESAQLVRRLRKIRDPEAVRTVLDDPWHYIAAAENGTKPARDSDPRLSEAGNRLRCSLLSWERASDQLTRALCHACVADARVLAPLVQGAMAAGTQALRELEATHSCCSAQLAPTQGEQADTVLIRQRADERIGSG
jgi:ParB/RepB/Spo0J family partition protein